MKNVFNPGSDEAVQAGCTCPVIDNHYGKGVPSVENLRVFWMNSECPIHGYNKESGLPKKPVTETVVK